MKFSVTTINMSLPTACRSLLLAQKQAKEINEKKGPKTVQKIFVWTQSANFRHELCGAIKASATVKQMQREGNWIWCDIRIAQQSQDTQSGLDLFREEEKGKCFMCGQTLVGTEKYGQCLPCEDDRDAFFQTNDGRKKASLNRRLANRRAKNGGWKGRSKDWEDEFQQMCDESLAEIRSW